MQLRSVEAVGEFAPVESPGSDKGMAEEFRIVARAEGAPGQVNNMRRLPFPPAISASGSGSAEPSQRLRFSPTPLK